MGELKSIDQISERENIYIAPAGVAAEKFSEIIKKERPDVDIRYFLDTYKSSYLSGGTIKRIDQVNQDELDRRVVVVVERDVIRQQIIDSLRDAEFENICWIGHDFVVSEYSEVQSFSQTMVFFYDFSVNTINHDFLISLAHADAERKELGLKNMHVVLVPQKENSIFDLSRASLQRQGAVLESDNYWFIHNVIVPSMSLLPSCSGFSFCGSRYEAKQILSNIQSEIFPSNYSVDCPVGLESILNCNNGNIYDGKGYGQPFCSNQSSSTFVRRWFDKRGLDNSKSVVITLRQNRFSEERNSNLASWKCFADKVVESGYIPIFVKDTYTSFDKSDIDDYLVFNEASWNILLRMALYEEVYLNMIVNTGPVELCRFNSKVRYINFAYVSEKDFAGSSSFHKAAGSPIGTQYPGASCFQKTVWGGGDDCKKILDEFESMISAIENNDHAC